MKSRLARWLRILAHRLDPHTLYVPRGAMVVCLSPGGGGGGGAGSLPTTGGCGGGATAFPPSAAKAKRSTKAKR